VADCIDSLRGGWECFRAFELLERSNIGLPNSVINIMFYSLTYGKWVWEVANPKMSQEGGAAGSILIRLESF
jgi:hypothetical protein